MALVSHLPAFSHGLYKCIAAGTETLRPCLVPTSHRSETLRPLLAGLGLEEDMASYADGFGITPPRIQPWTL